ncbi:radical SAM protein [Candidatus Woesearchaeota archaeon]|nr:MAG: radical SAM protein [Candidatus Woesearchaeota archaeon]
MGLEDKVKVEVVRVKSIITKSSLPDADFVINPYVGCQHGCIYCYADFMRRFTGHSPEEWGSFVDVKQFDFDRINPHKFDGMRILLSSVTDPYQPLEAKYKITRRVLERFIGSSARIDVLTKSALVKRDIDIFKQIPNIRVGVSVSVLNHKISRRIEPFSSSPSARLESLRRIHEEGVRTYLFVSPLMPGISEYQELVFASKDYVEEVMFENLNIRANNINAVYSFLEEFQPDLITFYNELRSNPQSWNPIREEVLDYCRKHGLKCKLYFHHGGFKK